MSDTKTKLPDFGSRLYRRHQAAILLGQGCELSEIATELGISIPTIVQYLYTCTGEGRVRRSDILFAIPRETRRMVEQIISETTTTEFKDIWSEIKARQIASSCPKTQQERLPRREFAGHGSPVRYFSDRN